MKAVSWEMSSDIQVGVVRDGWKSEARAAAGQALAQEIHTMLDGHGEASANELSELAVAFRRESGERFLPRGLAGCFRRWLGFAHGTKRFTAGNLV